MRTRFPIILDLVEPLPTYHWRLVASTYHSAQAMLEGAAVFIVVLIISAARTHLVAFSVLAAAASTITMVRMWDRRQFMRARAFKGDGMAGTPEGWMLRNAAGAMAIATLWGAGDVYVLLFTSDVHLQLLMLMAQVGWICGASVRIVVCPAAVLGQLVVTLLPIVIALCLVPEGLIKIGIPTGLLYIAGLLRISRSLGLLVADNIQSEQRAEAMNAQLVEANAKLTRLTLIDGLTGIANRRAFDEALELEWSRANRENLELSLLMIDVDFFKPYNDRYGHQAGDDCLRLVAQCVFACTKRPADLGARYGGEEFVALLPATDDRGAWNVAERLRTALGTANIPHEAAPLGRVSVSIGIASVTPSATDDWRAIICRADAALYEAKRGGRNRVHGARARAECVPT